MLMGCNWWISIRLVCLACQKTDGKRKAVCMILNELLGFTWAISDLILKSLYGKYYWYFILYLRLLIPRK